MLALGAVIVYLLYTHIKCPNCGASPFTWEEIKSGNHCYNCGFKLSDRNELKQAVADKYGDNRAGKIDWTPLNTASSNFDNYKMHFKKNGLIVFKPIFGPLAFGSLFLLVGNGIMFVMVFVSEPQ